MYGRSVGQDKAQIAPSSSAAGTYNGFRRQGMSGITDSTFNFFPIGLVIALGLYFVWAMLEQHEKIRTAVKPQAIGLNLRNIAVIIVTVILGLNLAKIVVGKLSAWGIPGAGFAKMLVGGA